MPVLIDEDLRFEDGYGPRPATVMNEWLRELPISGAPSPRTWRPYAMVLKSWAEFLAVRRVPVFADRRELRESLSAYAEYRLSGPLEARLAPTHGPITDAVATAVRRSVGSHVTELPPRRSIAGARPGQRSEPPPIANSGRTRWRDDGDGRRWPSVPGRDW
jgi:hypothetical protein